MSSETGLKRRKPNNVKEPSIDSSQEKKVAASVVDTALPIKRRFYFVFGILFGGLMGYLFTEHGSQSLSTLSLELDGLSSFDVASLMELPSIPDFSIQDYLAPTREWLKSKATNFEIGRDAVARGDEKKFAVVIIPGIVSSGLESWSTSPSAASFFREKIWSSASMFKALLTRREAWIAAMSLDPDSGLDPPGFKVRAVEGIDGASSFMPGFWLWSKIIENLAVLDYDQSDLTMASYDWRVAWLNLEIRDQYFSRLQKTIEFNLAVNGKKTVILSHSMGSQVALWFLKWVEAEGFGNGGDNWCETHVASFFSIAGTFLGVPKAQAALLSGEMRDTVEINQTGAKLLERFFSRNDRASLFRSWGGASSMLLKGGNAVWGDRESAPDDRENATLSGGNIYYFRDAKNETGSTSNLTIEDAHSYILQHVPSSYQKMLASTYSFGFERDAEKLAANDRDHTKWTNPLEIRLPNAPSMVVYVIYGVGKETERSYWYSNGDYTRDEVVTAGEPVCHEKDCTPRTPLDMPLTRTSWIDTSVNLEDENPKVRSGVVFGEGDGTVSLLSLGAMAVDGWKRELYNPGGVSIVTLEILHDPIALDLRGGPRTADHVDILGSSEMQQAVMNVVTGNGDRIKTRLYSDIIKYAAKIKWDG